MRERLYCNGPPLQRAVTTTTTTAMDAVVQASFASLSLTAVVAHRLTAAAASGDGAKAADVDRDRDALKRKTYTALRNRYFGAYFFAMFGMV